MKLKRLLHRAYTWLPPQTWPEVYGVLTAMLLSTLTLMYALDWLKAVLP